MKISEKWLRENLTLEISQETLLNQLTMAGLEVDSIKPAAGEFSNVVVGHVIEIAQHPDADRLRICQVDIGEKAQLNIVCGAANVHEDAKVPVAIIGAVLPGNFKIKKSKLRGIESQGMICSAKELGLADDADGILLLPKEAPIGRDIYDYLELDDHIIELDLTPNRGDCLSIHGVARELAAINNSKIKSLETPTIKPTIKDTIPIKLAAPELCPHYTGRIVKGISIKAQSPLWMQEKLRRSHIRPISAVVDIMNYVMLECGQPMHAFDLSKINGGIVVRPAAVKEKITLLDGIEHSFEQDALLIADQSNAIALAGIMGGLDSAVTDTTQDIFIESAFFTPEPLFETTHHYTIFSDSSHRFERGVDFKLQLYALERATELMLAIVGGNAGPIIEETVQANMPSRKPISLRQKRVEQIAGIKIPEPEMINALSNLGLTVEKKAEALAVTAPSYRFDLAMEIDLIEELVRLYGYDSLPSTHSKVVLQPPVGDNHRAQYRCVEDALVHLGYHQVMNFSFMSGELLSLFDEQFSPVSLANPISSDMNVMRTTLLPGLLQNVSYNLNRQQPRVRLFEIGTCFVQDKDTVVESQKLAGVANATRYPEQWGEKSVLIDFYDIKADVLAIIKSLGLNTVECKPYEHPALHPGKSAQILSSDKPLGFVGEVHPSIVQKMDLQAPVYIFELLMDNMHNSESKSYHSISKYPAIRRDVAIIIDEGVAAETICRAIRDVVGEYLQELILFDLYQGEAIDLGKKSIALGLTLQDSSRTLVDDEVNHIMDKVIALMKSEFGAQLR